MAFDLIPAASVWSWDGWDAVAALAQVVAVVAAAVAAWAAMRAANASLTAQRDARHALALGLEPVLDVRQRGDGVGLSVVNVSPGQGPVLDLVVVVRRDGVEIVRQARASLDSWNWPQGRDPIMATAEDHAAWLIDYAASTAQDRIQISLWDSRHTGRWLVDWYCDEMGRWRSDWLLATY